MGMTLKEVKAIAGDWDKNTRWAIVESPVYGGADGTCQVRIVGIGTKHVRVLNVGGIWSARPSEIRRVW